MISYVLQPELASMNITMTSEQAGIPCVDDASENRVNGDCRASMGSCFLLCSLCHQHYTKPKLLPCLHTFCKQCIDSYTPAHSLAVVCPVCRHQSILPPDGIDSLHDNTYIIQMADVVDEYQQLSSNTDADFAALTSESGYGQLSAIKLVCRSHEGQPMTHYCLDCETVFCGCCSEHTDHRYEILTMSTVAPQMNDLKCLIHSSLEGPVVELHRALDAIHAVDSSLAINYAEAQNSIQETFDALVQTVLQRRDNALAELNVVYNQKDQALKNQAAELNRFILSVSSCCKFTLKSFEDSTCGAMEVLIARRELTDRLNDLGTSSLQSPAESECLSFDVRRDDITSIQNAINGLGVIGTGGAVPFETTVTGDGTRQCWPNRPTTVTITARDRKGAHVRVGHSAFTAMIVPSVSSSKSVREAYINEITDNSDGTYDLSYIVRQPGTFHLDIKLHGHQVRGSPFRIRAHHETTEKSSRPRLKSDGRFESSPSLGGSSSAGGSGSRGTKNPSSSRSQGSQRKGTPVEDDMILRVGTQGRNKGEFLNPQGVAFYRGSAGDRVLVADSNNQCIQVFDAANGECLLKFGTRGRLAGQLQRPTGVAVTPSGNYLVADYDNKWVGIYSADGKYISRLGVGKLLGPKGVCCDSNGRIIVVDNRGSGIYIFQPNGRLIHKFGSRSSTDPRHLAGPHFCALTPSGRDIVVTDFHNHCVKVFDLEAGSLKFCFGSAGEGNGQFGAPTGVAVDKNGNILVADWGNNRIQVFDSEGSFLSFVNTSGDPLYGPQGIAFTEDGNILVADSGNHCFKIYRHLL